MDEEDPPEIVERKEFNRRISAARKPYFMIYVYPKLRKETGAYIQNNDRDIIRRYSRYGYTKMADLEDSDDLTPEMQERLGFYHDQFPVGRNACIVNRIARIFEEAFDGYIKSFSARAKVNPALEFDYRILKSGAEYSKLDYTKIGILYQEYDSIRRRWCGEQNEKKTEKAYSSFDRLIYVDYFKIRCLEICPNEKELCDIILDMCYHKESVKQFVWDVCGETIVQNLLEKCGWKIQYPVLTDGIAEFSYCGRNFIMQEQEIGGDAE